MLLYNSFLPLLTPPGRRPLVRMGGCCMTNTRCWGRNWPDWLPPDNRFALAVTLCLLPRLPARLPALLGGDGLHAGIVNNFAMPFECLFCNPPAGLAVEPQAPGWAAALLEVSDLAPPDFDQVLAADEAPEPLQDPLDWRPRYALAMEFVPPRFNREFDPQAEGDQFA